VVVLHPVQFMRSADWDQYADFVASVSFSAAWPFPGAGLDYVRDQWFSRLVYSPLPAAYGLFYGGVRELTSYIDAHHGTAIDPNRGIGESPDPVGAPFYVAGRQSFAMNPPFYAALHSLAAVLDSFDRRRTYVVIAPVPQSGFDNVAAAERERAIVEISRELRIDRSAVLDTPVFLPDTSFSTVTHLTRSGRAEFTVALRKQICADERVYMCAAPGQAAAPLNQTHVAR
jgi:hypothetical protein